MIIENLKIYNVADVIAGQSPPVPGLASSLPVPADFPWHGCALQLPR